MYSLKADKDKFYTKFDTVTSCLNRINLESYDCIIEPSAGDGAFSNVIEHSNLIALDLEPEHDSIIKMDWFDFKLNKEYNKICVIGNPPFGKRNMLSKKFIKKAIEIGAEDICFILPNVYFKHTLQSIFPKEYRLSEFYELPKNSFSIKGVDYDMPCSFFIWSKSKGKDLRFNVNNYKTNDFKFITKKESNVNDFFILGASPNTVIEIDNISSTNRGYYIRPMEKLKKELVEKFKNIKFKALSSASGNVAWRTKPEILKNYIESIDV